MITEQTKQDFLAAWELVRNPETWTSGAYARDRAGGECGWSNPEAVCYCSLGALARIAQDDTDSLRAIAVERLFRGINVVQRNDAGHESACAMWREVAAKHGIELP